MPADGRIAGQGLRDCQPGAVKQAGEVAPSYFRVGQRRVDFCARVRDKTANQPLLIVSKGMHVAMSLGHMADREIQARQSSYSRAVYHGIDRAEAPGTKMRCTVGSGVTGQRFARS